MAVPMKNGGMKPSKVIYYVFLSGITTGIGALVGAILGGISPVLIASISGIRGSNKNGSRQSKDINQN